MKLEEAIKILKEIYTSKGIDGNNETVIKIRKEAIETVLKEIENKENDNKVWEKVYDEDEQQICDLNNKICELEFELDKLKNLQEDNC